MKRLIVCCDGTWQRPDQNWMGERAPTNVVKLAVQVAKLDGNVPQVVWYDQGVGTGNVFDLLSGGLIGRGLDDNIIEAYRFLVANFVPGDELYFFGFSRGAYTVRSLAGMIRKCGIVRRDKIESYSQAVALYRDEQKPDSPGPRAFREECSVVGDNPIPIQCIGVWDTVGALGIPLRGLSKLTHGKYEFHDTTLSGSVKHAYHALAVDERRDPFSPTLWSPTPKAGQVLEQVWFPGTHSDVGGGIGSRGLPDAPLLWMIQKAREAGLAFDSAVADAYPLQPDALAPMNLIERLPLWNLVRSERQVGVDEAGKLDRTQSLHASVLERWDRHERYRPGNLNEYFGRTHDSRRLEPRSGFWPWASKRA